MDDDSGRVCESQRKQQLTSSSASHTSFNTLTVSNDGINNSNPPGQEVGKDEHLTSRCGTETG